MASLPTSPPAPSSGSDLKFWHVFGTASRIRPSWTAYSRTRQPSCSQQDCVVFAGHRCLTRTLRRWGGWGSNPRPADYENYGPALPTLYLHGYHGAVPPMALIALYAQVARSTNRSTTTTASAGLQLRSVTADRARSA
jgi:hypothetical protein